MIIVAGVSLHIWCELHTTVFTVQDGTGDLNSSQLHSCMAVDRINQDPTGTIWSLLNWTLELVIMATLVMPSFNLSMG